jgi:hypothetical protein
VRVHTLAAHNGESGAVSVGTPGAGVAALIFQFCRATLLEVEVAVWAKAHLDVTSYGEGVHQYPAEPFQGCLGLE